jgi:hypothetical protein
MKRYFMALCGERHKPKKAEDFSSTFAYLRAIVVTVVCSPL